MATWSDLNGELDRWRATRFFPTLWWRDDDAQTATQDLEPLLELSTKFSVPVHLAVIPDLLRDSLCARLEGCDTVSCLQHGFAHVNHEPAEAGASEFGDHRDIALQRRDLRAGWLSLVRAQLPNLLPGVVPPWNRMSDPTLLELPGLGYRFISAFEGPTASLPIAGLSRFNAHVDPMRWRHGGRFRGTEATLEFLTGHLAARRTGQADLREPTGLLTHHLLAGSDLWDFVSELLERLEHQGVARWVNLASLLKTG